MDHLKQSIGKALGRVPSGVFILTTRHNGQAQAMLASWVQQTAFEPPGLCVAIAKDRPIGQTIQENRRFALSVLGESDSALMKKYARGIPPDTDPFAGVKVIETADGMPVLADALAFLDCSLMQVCSFEADHDLFIAQIIGGNLLKPGPAFTHQRGNGFHY